MEQYLRSILTAKTKSPATLKNRVAYVFMLYRMLDSDSTNLSFLNDKKSVMELVNNSINLGTRKTRLFHIVETIKLDKSKSVKPDVKLYYVDQAEKLKPIVKELEDNNVMNEKQIASHITIPTANLMLETYLRSVFNDYGIKTIDRVNDEDFARLMQMGPRKNIFTFAKGVQESLIPALYIWQTALRNDYSDMKITRRIIIPNKGNWLQIKKDGSMSFIINEYKTAKYFGKQRFAVNHKLAQLITIWIDLLQRIMNKAPTYLLYYSINAKGDINWISNVDTLGRQLSRISLKIFKKPATINSFRHAHEIRLQQSDDYKRMTQGERRAAHEKLLHGLETGQKYNLLRRD